MLNKTPWILCLLLNLGGYSMLYAADLEPVRQMPASLPIAQLAYKFKLDFAYSFDQENNRAQRTDSYLHDLRLKLSWQHFYQHWLQDLQLETSQRRDETGQVREQYLNSFKLANYKNALNYRFAKTQWEKDSLNDYQSSLSLTTGLGRDFFVSPKASFSGEIGIGYRHNESTEQQSDHEGISTAGLFYKHQFHPMLSYEQNLSYEWAQDNQILRGKSALNLRINSAYVLQASYQLKRQNDLLNHYTDSKIAFGFEYRYL
jgi:putative salt-induced outer membrane protein YdiY